MECYLFDFDGTLVDSMPVWSRKVLSILEKRGIGYPADILRLLTPLGDKGCAEYYIREMGVEATIDELFAEMDAYALPRYRDEIPAKESVREALAALRARGVRCAVLTASPHRMLDPCLNRTGLAVYFDEIWSCDDFHTTKADPEIYRMAASALGCRLDELVFFDDNLNAVKSAKAAGCRTVGVFDESSREDEAAIRAASDHYIESFAPLLSDDWMDKN